MSIIEARRARYGVGARNIRSASASVNGERLGASMQGLLDSNRSLLQSCTIIYNNGRWRAVLVEKGFAGCRGIVCAIFTNFSDLLLPQQNVEEFESWGN